MNIATATRLVEYRKNRGMSQEELAATLGISRQAVSKWERAEASPDTDNLIALARLYGVSLDELLSANAPQQHAAPQPVTAAATIYMEPPAAPEPPAEVQPTEWEVAPAAQPLYAEPVTYAVSGERKPLSNEARLVLKVGAVLLGVVCFFTLGMMSWIFPSIHESYAILCTLVYLLIGFLGHKWHPTWLIYLTIPLFYTIF